MWCQCGFLRSSRPWLGQERSQACAAAVPGSIAPNIGGIAAVLASLSYLPQVRKVWPRGSTDDLSEC
ncbi:PQ-loop domain-containing transporter [Bradyrhizobium canariense]|uniref:PQ-loop domain-containing transporter n=1 Tax=Bradyrhizobium canariense TaxID=255045 RepID=UPI0030837489